MQGVNIDEQKQHYNDDEPINLGPPSNFKHKKYLTSKFGEVLSVEANSFSLGDNKPEKVNNTMKASAAAQPPLPPNSPPPDTPPMIINLKQEIENDEYTSSTVDSVSDFNQPDELTAGCLPVKPDQAEKVTMCRNFARGTCTKGPTCIFVHEIILAQLPGVYTFCRNFQKSVCSLPQCKFIHATIFEMEHFYRTGYLPPHFEGSNGLRAHTPPPQPGAASLEQPLRAAVQQSPVYSNDPLTTTIPCNENVVRNNREIDIDGSDASFLKCRKCAPTELRELLLKNKVSELTCSNNQACEKISRFNMNNAKLTKVLESYDANQAADKFTLPQEKVFLFQRLLNSNDHITSTLAKFMLASDITRSESA